MNECIPYDYIQLLHYYVHISESPNSIPLFLQPMRSSFAEIKKIFWYHHEPFLRYELMHNDLIFIPNLLYFIITHAFSY